jgi:hypothetical protein
MGLAGRVSIHRQILSRSTDMAFLIPSRSVLHHAAGIVLAVCCFSAPMISQTPKPGFTARQAAPPRSQRPQPEHLERWMDSHRNLTRDQQRNAFAKEPGFKELPAQTQQRMLDRLSQLNNMPAESRRRLLERTEIMERLTPPQRQQVRGALQQLSGLPVERRRLVARAFRDIRTMPVPQREVILNSDRFRSQFSNQERGTLSNLLTVEPYLPTRNPDEVPESPK